MTAAFVRKCHAPRPNRFIWFILVGVQCEEHWVELATPCEEQVRRLLNIPEGVPILIGRP